MRKKPGRKDNNTLNKAAEMARKYLAAGGEEDLRRKRDHLHQRVLQVIPDLALNCHPVERLPKHVACFLSGCQWA
ncbi:MAG TPA: hypothetical protein VF268_07665 [Gammaproteobacteria bacterium]